ncbi:unnamed protein product, partial [Polarella glacialis]
GHQWGASLSLLRLMSRAAQLVPGASTANAAVSALGSARQWHRATDLLLESMSLANSSHGLVGVSPEAFGPGCAAALLACCESVPSHWRHGIALLAVISFRSLRPDVASFGLISMHCEQNGQAAREIDLIWALAPLR